MGSTDNGRIRESLCKSHRYYQTSMDECTRRPKRFREFWTTAQDRMAKERSKMFRRASRSNRSEDRGKYHMLDRKVKRTARANKRAGFKKFIEELDMKSPVDFQKG